MSGPAIFVDESKAKDYLLIAAAIIPRDLAQCRRVIQELRLPGQPRLHMKQENDSRKRLMLSTFAKLEARVTIYRAPRSLGTELHRRGRCIDELVADLGDAGGRLCLERDETLVARDRQRMIEATRRVGNARTLEYRHESAASEPLLAIPDAVGWAWARGGDWRRRAQPLVVDIVDIES